MDEGDEQKAVCMLPTLLHLASGTALHPGSTKKQQARQGLLFWCFWGKGKELSFLFITLTAGRVKGIMFIPPPR